MLEIESVHPEINPIRTFDLILKSTVSFLKSLNLSIQCESKIDCMIQLNQSIKAHRECAHHCSRIAPRYCH